MSTLCSPISTRHLTPLALACALAWLGTSAQAQTVTGQILLDGATKSSTSGATVSDSFVSPNVATASYIADAATGVLRVAAGHSGNPGRTDTTVTFSQTLTNATGIAQSVSFSFYVYAGSISATTGYDGVSGAGYLADIDWGGNTVWRAGVDITKGGQFSGAPEAATFDRSASASDFAFNTNTDGWAYTADWQDYGKTLGLGVLNPGESRTLTYTMSTYSYSSGNNFEPYGGAVGIGSDPLHFDTTPLPGTPVGLQMAPAAPVPEPEALAMMALGLGVVGVAARRQSRRQRGR